MPLHGQISADSHVLFSISLIQDKEGDQESQTGEEFNAMADDLLAAEVSVKSSELKKINPTEDPPCNPPKAVKNITLMLADTLQRHRLMALKNLSEEEAIQETKKLLKNFLLKNKDKINQLKAEVEKRGGKFNIINWDICRGVSGSHKALDEILKEIFGWGIDANNAQWINSEAERAEEFAKAQIEVDNSYCSQKKNEEFARQVNGCAEKFARQLTVKYNSNEYEKKRDNFRQFILEECVFQIVAAKDLRERYNYELYRGQRSMPMRWTHKHLTNMTDFMKEIAYYAAKKNNKEMNKEKIQQKQQLEMVGNKSVFFTVRGSTSSPSLSRTPLPISIISPPLIPSVPPLKIEKTKKKSKKHKNKADRTSPPKRMKLGDESKSERKWERVAHEESNPIDQNVNWLFATICSTVYFLPENYREGFVRKMILEFWGAAYQYANISEHGTRKNPLISFDLEAKKSTDEEIELALNEFRSMVSSVLKVLADSPQVKDRREFLLTTTVMFCNKMQEDARKVKNFVDSKLERHADAGASRPGFGVK